MTDTPSDAGKGDTLDPPGGHSREALEDAEKKMNVKEGTSEFVADPPGGHDPEALKDAEKKMGIDE
jgi:hypothetical protein